MEHPHLLVAAAIAASASACVGNITVGNGAGDAPPVVTPGEHCDDERPGPRQLRLLTRREYANTLHDLLGVDVDTAPIPVEPRIKGFDDNAAAMVVTDRHIDAFLALAEDASDRAVTTQRARLLHCDPSVASCKREFVTELGLRAFRRPLTDDEIDGFLAAFQANSFDDGMRIATAAMLISPNFLYRWEVGDDAGTLSPYETASALSYLFWGTMPDPQLFDAAAAGELSTPEQITTQARRLLADARARPEINEFVGQWLRTDGLTANKDATIYPSFTDQIRDDMAEEQRRFFEHVIFEQNGSFEDLFTADYVYANASLAQFYDLPPPSSDWAQVPVAPDSGRGGILGLGAVLASHAHSNESSPIKRGVFVRTRLLCQDLAPPPPDVDATPPGLDPSLTTRERFAAHDENPACSGCHKYIDGVGFGFEGFDGVGARRTVENGLPVDMSGTVVSLEGFDKDTRDDFKDTRALGALLAGSASAQACLPLQYFRYARGYSETVYDACTINNLQLDFSEGRLNLQDMLVAVTGSPIFTKRKVQ
jgi:Protein of unknown function (DUF1592)/Protein of unknown function (DUF1588)/Protein of unknown function (DUF1595)/Protein of unknown function (DUF1587)/Protein of unknown function (DUF1585)